jgi:hypothetical protein
VTIARTFCLRLFSGITDGEDVGIFFFNMMINRSKFMLSSLSQPSDAVGEVFRRYN